MATGDRDHPAVERSGGVVGVTFQLGRRPQGLGPRFASRLTPLRSDREEARNPRRRGESHAPPAGKSGADAQPTLAPRAAKRAHRRVVLGCGLVAGIGDLEVNPQRDRDGVERGADVRRGGRHANDPTRLHACQPRAFSATTFGTCNGSARGSDVARSRRPRTRSTRARAPFGSTRRSRVALAPAISATGTPAPSGRRAVGRSKIGATPISTTRRRKYPLPIRRPSCERCSMPTVPSSRARSGARARVGSR